MTASTTPSGTPSPAPGDHWIVVGAGSAGCVVANRLSADPDRHVTVLDDGPDLRPTSTPPSISGDSFLAALGEPGRIHDDLTATRTTGGPSTLYTRGRGIGGSSAVNAMLALRGDDAQYAAWGWTDTATAWNAVQIPAELADPDELGAVDRALLASCADARPARLTRRNGRRVTAAEAYLWPVTDRPNLTISPNSAVERIDLAGRRATGVTLVDGTSIDADHVVLCAGAIHTPTILLRSGIDTPGIGVGLNDHPAAPLTLALRSDVEQTPTGLVVGSLAEITINDHLVQLLPMNHLGAANPGLALLMAAVMNPTGRGGTVTIDTDGNPVVDFALLDNDDDLAALAAAVRHTLDLLGTPAFTDIVEQVHIDEHGTTVDALTDDATLRSWLRTRAGDYVHASSSCAMGTVVGDDYALLGHEAISVCDASIFPNIPDVNTHLPVSMAAERFCLRATMQR